jgi:hypothetical protein
MLEDPTGLKGVVGHWAHQNFGGNLYPLRTREMWTMGKIIAQAIALIFKPLIIDKKLRRFGESRQVKT